MIEALSELSYEQRKEAREHVEKCEREEFGKRRLLIKSLQKGLGPVGEDVGTCCGR